MNQTADLTIRHANPNDASLLAELGARTFSETFAADNAPEDISVCVVGRRTTACRRCFTKSLTHVELAQVCGRQGAYLVPKKRGFMFRQLGVVGMLVLGVTFLGLAQKKRSYDESSCSYFHYKKLEYSICYDDNDLASTPSWDPEKSEPPLPRVEALERSRAFMARFVANPQLWQIEHINLERVGDKNKWVYDIEFDCPIQSCGADYRSSFKIILKMDGEAIEPTISAK